MNIIRMCEPDWCVVPTQFSLLHCVLCYLTTPYIILCASWWKCINFLLCLTFISKSIAQMRHPNVYTTSHYRIVQQYNIHAHKIRADFVHYLLLSMSLCSLATNWLCLLSRNNWILHYAKRKNAATKKLVSFGVRNALDNVPNRNASYSSHLKAICGLFSSLFPST